MGCGLLINSADDAAQFVLTVTPDENRVAVADSAVAALATLLHEPACKAHLLWPFARRCVNTVRDGGSWAAHALYLLCSLVDRLPRHASNRLVTYLLTY